MAQNFIQPGEHLELTNGTGSTITSGSPVFDGQIVGIALGDIADGKAGQVRTQGVFKLAKKASLAISEGDALFWDATPGEITKTAADGKFIGYAAAAALAAATHVNVLLVQTPKAANIAALTGGESPTEAEFNALLTVLKNAGLMATS